MNIEEKDILEIKEEENGDTLTPSEEVDVNQEQPIHEEETIVEEETLETEEPTLDENIESLEPELPEEETPKMFDQNYVNELVGRTRIEARDKAMRSLYDRYGVETEDELNEIFGRGQSYNILNNDYNELNTRYGDVMAENALLKSALEGNVTVQIFWLKNRKKEQWREKQEYSSDQELAKLDELLEEQRNAYLDN